MISFYRLTWWKLVFNKYLLIKRTHFIIRTLKLWLILWLFTINNTNLWNIFHCWNNIGLQLFIMVFLISIFTSKSLNIRGTWYRNFTFVIHFSDTLRLKFIYEVAPNIFIRCCKIWRFCRLISIFFRIINVIWYLGSTSTVT